MNSHRYKEVERDEPDMSEIVIVRRITDEGLDLIKRFEGFSPMSYRCPANYLSIGFGHEVLPGEKFDEPISEEEALTILENDVKVAERSVCRLISVGLEDWQYDALVSFTYNLGGRRLQISTMRRRVNEEKHHLVPSEIRKWVYAGTKRLGGLIKRRNAEALMYAGAY